MLHLIPTCIVTTTTTMTSLRIYTELPTELSSTQGTHATAPQRRSSQQACHRYSRWLVHGCCFHSPDPDCDPLRAPTHLANHTPVQHRWRCHKLGRQQQPSHNHQARPCPPSSCGPNPQSPLLPQQACRTFQPAAWSQQGFPHGPPTGTPTHGTPPTLAHAQLEVNRHQDITRCRAPHYNNHHRYRDYQPRVANKDTRQWCSSRPTRAAAIQSTQQTTQRHRHATPLPSHVNTTTATVPSDDTTSGCRQTRKSRPNTRRTT